MGRILVRSYAHMSRRRKTEQLLENLQGRLDTLPDRGYEAGAQLLR